MKYFKRFILLISLIAIPLLAYLFYWNKHVTSLNFIFTSDGHGHIVSSILYDKKNKPKIGGLSVLGGYLEGLKKPYLLTDSGDIFHGTPEGILTKGRVVVEIMNILGYDAAAVGNHDFDLGQETLRDLSELAEFPFLGANIREENTGNIPGYLGNSIIKEMKGVKIGVIGVITPEIQKISISENVDGLNFLGSAETINENIKSLKEAGAEVIIVLSHLGLAADSKIAGEIKGVNAILGGHSHKELKEPLKKKEILICHAGAHFKSAGYLKLFYSNKEKRVLSYSYKVVPLYEKKYKSQEAINNVIDSVYSDSLADMNKIIGKSKQHLPNYFTGKTKKHEELALGNWQTDLMRELAESDFAFQNTKGIRSSIPGGDIKIRDMWKVSPFGNTLVKMTLTGKQVNQLLEHSMSKEYAGLQLSGLKVVYNNSLPLGRRILNIIITDDKGEKKEIEMDKEYSVVTNSYLAQGGDGYNVFKEGIDIEKIDVVFRDKEIEYIKNKSPISAEIEGRRINVSIDNTMLNN